MKSSIGQIPSASRASEQESVYVIFPIRTLSGRDDFQLRTVSRQIHRYETSDKVEYEGVLRELHDKDALFDIIRHLRGIGYYVGDYDEGGTLSG